MCYYIHTWLHYYVYFISSSYKWCVYIRTIFRNVTIIRTRGRELKLEQECNRAGSCAHQARWMSAATSRLPLFSAVLASVPATPEPAYPGDSSASLATFWLTRLTQWLPRRYYWLCNGIAGGPGRRRPGVTDRGEERRARPLHGLGSSGAGETDQVEREADEVQGRSRGSGASAGRQERPWRL